MNIDTNRLLEEGDAHFKNGQLIKAEEAYKKIINHKPNHIQALNNLGVTLQKLSKLKEAELIYKKTIELNPDNLSAYNNLGIIFHALGKFDEAELSLRKTINLKPNYAMAYSNLGIIVEKLGRLVEAKEIYIHIVKCETKRKDGLENLGSKSAIPPGFTHGTHGGLGSRLGTVSASCNQMAILLGMMFI